MNKKALYSDVTRFYVNPVNPHVNEKVIIRCRTAKDDVDELFLKTIDERIIMNKRETKGLFDYYEVEYQLGSKRVEYCFELHSKDEVCYFNKGACSNEPLDFYSFAIVPEFSTPEWAKGAVIYQIFVDRFCNGDRTNDVETGEYAYIGEQCQKVKNWGKYPAFMGVREFYGGDLKGVWDKLDYLQDLGVEVIYLNPIFVSPSNHKYDTQDYDYVDPHYGVIVEDGGEPLPKGSTDNSRATMYQKRVTSKANLEASNQFFAELVEEIHRRGMKIILDGVFNHCGSFNKWMDRERIYENQKGYEKGAYISKDSPYHDFFKFYDQDEKKWPYNGSYDGWWGHDTLPKLNYEDSSYLEEYILNIGKKWVSPPYNIDGWRLDVAADLGKSNEYNHQFWKKFRRVVKEANPNAIILAEHYGDPSEWLEGDEWDTVMNYDAFMEPVTWFLTGMEKHSDDERMELFGNGSAFVYAMQYHMANMLTPSLYVAMNELSNHDHSRFLTRTNHMVGRVQKLGYEAASEYVNEAIMREAVIIQMTWPGAPTIYYGDEAGVCGFTDPDNRRTYPWGKENKELIQFHKDVIHIHKKYKSFRFGSILMLTWKENVLAYARFTDKERIVVIINNSSEFSEIVCPVWRAEVQEGSSMRRLIYSYEEGYTLEYEEFYVQDGEVVVNMGPHSALVLKNMSHTERN